MSAGGIFNVGEDLLRLYLFYSALLILKMLFMPIITSYFRQTKKVSNCY